ncbi:MAG TPA: SsrA-binding protein SmpB [bacterium]|jgi:SsrA-binding protein|nr:SsrA-binding protein SmpB [bacterium]HOR57093.1 SsrA-binding protein SmpB [bacterium]HPL56124.1 SsrA-binding protein SmpB [bacterium]HPM27693.1 SsrA-binding protein SmpB [bacterium]
MKKIDNKKAHFQYEIGDTIEAGIVLLGDEIKALRAGKVSLAGSFGRVLFNEKGTPELWLVGAHIGSSTLDPTRSRKLLVHKNEIKKLIGATQEKGLTLVPTKIYFKKGRAKIALSQAKGKNIYDKRQTIKKRDIEREIKQRTKFNIK